MRLGFPDAGVTDWEKIEAVQVAGESGVAAIRARMVGDVQFRLVSYSPDYVADHWCHKGHIVFVVSGSLSVRFEDGRRADILAGESFHVGDGVASAHRVVSPAGATAFIID